MRAIWVVMLAACIAPPKAAETLGDSIRIYNEGVRWERFAVAATHVPVQERSQFVDDADQRAKDVKITEYDIVRVDKRGDREAKVHVKLSWYRESEGTLHQTQTMQSWERLGKEWLIVDEQRLRGDQMPGLAEAVVKAATE